MSSFAAGGVANPEGIGMWDASPVHTLIRFIEDLDLEDGERTHLRLVIKRITEAEPDLNDIGRQIIARSLCATYAALVKAQTRALRAKPGTKQHESLWATTMRLQDHVTKLVRTLGLKPPQRGGAKGAAKGTGFTPPRPRRPSERAAQLLDQGGPEDDPSKGESL